MLLENEIKDEERKNFFVIPYIDTISDRVASLIKKSEMTIGYHCLNKLNRFIKVHKDKNQHVSNSNVVYKVNCKDCDATYVGQTKRKLSTRIKEHVNNIRLDSSRHSVISEHI